MKLYVVRAIAVATSSRLAFGMRRYVTAGSTTALTSASASPGARPELETTRLRSMLAATTAMARMP